MRHSSLCSHRVLLATAALFLITRSAYSADAPAATPKAATAPKAAAAAPAAPAAGTNPKLDPVLRKALEEMKYNKYDVNTEGMVKLSFNLGGGRSQIVFVCSRRDAFWDVDYRRIFSTAMKSKDVPSADILQQLMSDNGQKKIGAWELVKWPDGYRILLCAKVPADCPTKTLQSAIKFVLNGADEMELKLTGKDEF